MADTLETIINKLSPERQESIKARAEELIKDELGRVDLEDSTDSAVRKFEPAKPVK
jgi:hypothetical protein